MTDTVVDSSVVAKWILPEADSAQAQHVIADVALQGLHLFILDLALVEVANAIWKRHHRGLATLDEARLFLGELIRSPVRVEPATPLLGNALEIATRFGRSVYDSLFIALTVERGVRGVTADEPLYRAVHAAHPQIILLRNW
jgi:predicted nucleic acid-binding protein